MIPQLSLKLGIKLVSFYLSRFDIVQFRYVLWQDLLQFKAIVTVFAFISDSFEGPESRKDCFSEFTTTPSDENLTVRGKSPEFATERCHSTATGVWMLTCVFRPTRKILFAYVRTVNALLVFSGRSSTTRIESFGTLRHH